MHSGFNKVPVPEKIFRTLFFSETSLEKYWDPQDIAVKTVETSSQTGTIEMFQKQNNYLNNTVNYHWWNSTAKNAADLNLAGKNLSHLIISVVASL